MQGSNRSGLQCLQHPNQEITNYCLHFDCLKPLCPDCVELHTKFHQKQEIESWKHCVNKSARNVKTTLDVLRGIYQKNNQYQIIKSVDMVESQNIKRLQQIKEKVLKLVEDVFNIHEQRLRNVIRAQYKIDPPDTNKLKSAIQQLEKILMKLGHSATVLPALKKSLLLDHESLKNFFTNMDYKNKNAQINDIFVSQTEDPLKLRNHLQSIIKINNSLDYELNINNNYFKANSYGNSYQSPNIGFKADQSARSDFEQNNNLPISISSKNYFLKQCDKKLLHFFIPSSRQMKILNLQNVGEKKQWQILKFQAKNQVPSFFKSIITPNGQIYLTGGSNQESKRFKEIYRYNFQKNSLELISNMLNDRSSHSICFLNGSIYLIGGFSRNSGEISKECEVFNLRTKQCSKIASMKQPSANSCAVAFGDNFILKFGGVCMKADGNNTVQLYNVQNDTWNFMKVDTSRAQNKLFQFLSFSAAVQINEKQILAFGGYDNSDSEKPEKTCYTMEVDLIRNEVKIKNYNKSLLPFAEGFWNNNPIVHNGKVYALQNVTDIQDNQTAIADQLRVLIFNGDRWN